MMSRDTSFGSDSFRKGPRSYSDSRSRFDDRSSSNVDYSNDSRSYQSQPPNPSGSFGNAGNFNSRDSTAPRYSGSRASRFNDEESPRYGGGGGGDASQYDNGSSYTNSAPQSFNSVPLNYNNDGPPNYNNDGPPNYNNDGPPNYNSDGPPNYNSDGPPSYNSGSGPGNFGSGGPNFGGGGPPPPRPPGPMGGPPGRNSGYGNVPTENLFSSIQTLSEISKNDIASKILSAVLQTNLMGAQQGSSFSGPNFGGNQQGGPPFNDDQMGGYSDRKKYSPRSSRQGGGRGPPPRHSGPSGGPSRFSRERLRSMRISFPANRSKYDRSFPVKSRSSLSRKRSLSRSTPPRNTSKSKRRRTNSRERRESPRRKEDKDGTIKTERDSQEKEKEKDGDDTPDKKDDIPLAALYCHMCKHGNFTSVKTYLFHLDGVKHRKTAMAFHARNEATLEYLRKNAKLANVRFGGKEGGVSTSKCTVCTAIIQESFSKHKRLLEHKIVKKFMSPTCCGRYFKTRYDMNEHRLSLPHLRKVYEANEEKKIFLEDVTSKPGKWNHEDIVKQLMSRNPVPEGHLTLDNIPAFDGNTFIGIKFLRPKEATYCKPCKTLLPVGIKSLETHMVTIDHYDCVMDYLREKRKRKMEGGVKKEKKEGEEGFTDSDDSEDEKNADETADSARFTRHEREEEEDEDDDDEGAVIAVKGSDDEDEKEDDMPFFDEAAHIVLEEIGEDMPNKQEGGSSKADEEEEEHEGEAKEDEDQYEEPDLVQDEIKEDEDDEIQEADSNEYIPE